LKSFDCINRIILPKQLRLFSTWARRAFAAGKGRAPTDVILAFLHLSYPMLDDIVLPDSTVQAQLELFWDIVSNECQEGRKYLIWLDLESSKFFEFHSNDEEQRLDIVIYKKPMMKLFPTLLTVQNQLIADNWDWKTISRTDAQQTDKLYKIFLAIVPILFINNESHTLVLILESMVELLSIPNNKVLRLLQCLLTCSRNNINKSSSYWTFLRKLYSTNSFQQSIFIDTLIASATIHRKSYYCWNFASFFATIEFARGADLTPVYSQVKQFCMRNLDYGAWKVLCEIIIIMVSANTNQYWLKEFERWNDNNNNNKLRTPNNSGRLHQKTMNWAEQELFMLSNYIKSSQTESLIPLTIIKWVYDKLEL